MTLDYKGIIREVFNYERDGLSDLIAVLSLATSEEKDNLLDVLAKLIKENHKRFSIWCDRIESHSDDEDLLDMTIKASVQSPHFSELELSRLYESCIKCYLSNNIDISTLESKLVILINSTSVDNSISYRNPFYALGRAISICEDFDVSSFRTPKLDESLSRHAAGLSTMNYHENVVRPLSWISRKINVPITFAKSVEWYKSVNNPKGISALLELLVKSGGVESHHFKCLADVYGIKLVADSYFEVITYFPTMDRIYAFTDLYSEKYLFSDKNLSGHLSDVKKRKSLMILDIVHHQDFDPKLLPLFVGHALKVTPYFYPMFNVDHAENREAFRRLNVQHGKADQVWRLEKAYFLRQVPAAHQKEVGEDVPHMLEALRRHRPQQYPLALRAISEIGVDIAKADLGGAGRQFFEDYVQAIPMSHQEKRNFMKAFPKSKSMILEDDLGM